MITIQDGKIRISVRNLVEWLCCEGDIDAGHAGVTSKSAMEAGTKAHKRIQKSMGPNYQAEVPLAVTIPGEKYDLTIEGRADGIFEDEDAVCYIDEIKGTYADIRYFAKPVGVHRAQAMCYAYMVMKEQKQERMGIRMTYVNLDTEQVRYFEEVLPGKEIEDWFDQLVAELCKWADYVVTNRQRRDASISKLQFPFAYREGQKELAADVYRAIHRRKNLFIQAPTGVGKTLSTVFPAIKAMGAGEGSKLFYLTAKTITRTAANEAFERLRAGGLYFKTVTITAKDKICGLCQNGMVGEDGEKIEYPHPVCNPKICPYAKGHYDRINDTVYELVTSETVIDRAVIEKYANTHMVCPFELSLDVSYWMDGVVCDYNYAFDPHVHLKRFFAEGSAKDYIFLIDEAHNLVDRAREMYSASVFKEDFLALKHLVVGKDRKLNTAIERCNKNMLALKKTYPNEYTVLAHGEESALSLNMMRLQEELSRFMEVNKTFEEMDKLQEFFFDIMHYNEMVAEMDSNYVVYCEHLDSDFMLRLFCVNPAMKLKTYLEQGRGGVFFSATMLPVAYYKELLSGNVEDYAIYAHSPFDQNRRLLLVGEDVTSRYTRRNEAEYLKIHEYIHRVVDGHMGNYVVFFPSYQYMEAVYELCVRLGDDTSYELCLQKRDMKEEDREQFLGMFTQKRETKHSLVAFCVLGGIFSEGIDLRGEQLIGTIIVGTGLPAINTASQILRAYYDEKEHSGYEYAYIYPGMNKVLQAAGRVIRTSEDAGVVVLLDDRFLTRQYMKLFPREWENYRVTRLSESASKIVDFWDGLDYNIE